MDVNCCASLTYEAAPVLSPSVFVRILALLDTRSKCTLLSTCKYIKAVVEEKEQWRVISFADDSASDTVGSKGLTAMQLVGVITRAQGELHTLDLAGSQGARQAELQHRIETGVKLGMCVPHTRGLRAYALAALCPQLQRLSLDERASCIGGMTNDLARALAIHCRQLQQLEIYFERYSPPSELFSDQGLIAISEGCSQLRALTLHNADHLSDRSLYALAANCGGLVHLALAGYNENLTDGGLTVLFEACTGMQHVRLSGKLLKVTDITTAALAAHCPHLRSFKMTRGMSNASLALLAARCARLEVVDMRHCSQLREEGLLQLLGGCSRLQRLLLPPELHVSCELAQRPCCQLQQHMVEDELQQQELLIL